MYKGRFIEKPLLSGFIISKEQGRGRETQGRRRRKTERGAHTARANAKRGREGENKMTALYRKSFFGRRSPAISWKVQGRGWGVPIRPCSR